MEGNANLFYGKDDLSNKQSLLKCSQGWCLMFAMLWISLVSPTLSPALFSPSLTVVSLFLPSSFPHFFYFVVSVCCRKPRW